jgi:argininosuccinate lyase
MSLGANYGIGTSLEFDRETLAQKLGFQGITSNSFDSINDQDYFLEFINAATYIEMHLFQLIENISTNIEANNFYFATEIKKKDIHLIKGKLSKIFAYQTEINWNLHSTSIKQLDDFNANKKAVFELIDLLKFSLNSTIIILGNVRLNTDEVTNKVNKIAPSLNEIFDYLVQRNEPLKKAFVNAKILADLFEVKEQWKNVQLEELQRISSAIENDFYEELSLEKIINSKNQIGGTSIERVNEALLEASRALQFEE